MTFREPKKSLTAIFTNSKFYIQLSYNIIILKQNFIVSNSNYINNESYNILQPEMIMNFFNFNMMKILAQVL